MPTDDYDVILFKVLLYLYGCMKRRIRFNPLTFDKTTGHGDLPDEYFADVLRMMHCEGLIEGVGLVSAWGGDYIIVSDLRDMRITAAGIRYIKDNGKMKEIGEKLLSVPGLVADLIGIVQPFIK